jgi:SH3 domain protein
LRFSVPILMLSILLSAASLGADVRYVGGDQAVALRGGAGEDQPIVHRGIPPGSSVTVARTSDDGLWADITTDTGVTGWIPTRNLVLEVPPPPKTMGATNPLASAGETGADLTSGFPAPAPDATDLLNRINTCDAEFNVVAQELHQLKQISGKAEQLDIDNHRLVEEAENLRSDVEMLQAENQRLLDRLESEDFMNGALAVLLGVIIALIAPRLVPKRRKNSGWN